MRGDVLLRVLQYNMRTYMCLTVAEAHKGSIASDVKVVLHASIAVEL